MPYVRGVGVHRLYELSPPDPWYNATDQYSTSLPSYENRETGEVIRVFVGGSPTFKAAHHVPASGAPSSLSDPVATARTDTAMARELSEYFSRRAGVSADFDFTGGP